MNLKKLVQGVVGVLLGFGFLLMTIAVAVAIPVVNPVGAYVIILLSGILILLGCLGLLNAVGILDD